MGEFRNMLTRSDALRNLEEKRGTALGAYHTIVGITVLPANLIGGILWQKINVQAPFVYAAALSLISAVLLLILLRKK